MQYALIGASCAVETHIDLRLKTTVQFVASAHHEGRTDRRMVRHLLAVDQAAIENGLECLSEDRIEGFVHLKVRHSDRYHEGCNVFHTVHWVGLFYCSLQQKRSEGVGLAYQ